MSITEQIAAIESEREKVIAEYDAKLAALKKDALQELVAARSRVEMLERVLNVSKPVQQPQQPRKPSPYEGTDAGEGIGRDERSDLSAQAFRDELTELRERTKEKRRRLA